MKGITLKGALMSLTSSVNDYTHYTGDLGMEVKTNEVSSPAK